jgi:hypothetical protein
MRHALIEAFFAPVVFEPVIAVCGILLGTAALYLLSSGRIRVTIHGVSHWGRLPNGNIGVSLELACLVGIALFFAAVGIAYWIGWVH